MQVFTTIELAQALGSLRKYNAKKGDDETYFCIEFYCGLSEI